MPRAPTNYTATMQVRETMLGAVDAEIVKEQASSLGRAGRALEQAIADLAAFDAAEATKRTGRRAPPDRDALIAAARQALWNLVVQREACGFRNSADVLAVYQVPADVSRGVTNPQIVWRRRRR